MNPASSDVFLEATDVDAALRRTIVTPVTSLEVDYRQLWQDLRAGIEQASEESRSKDAVALQLLADACSMLLRPGSVNEPLVPFMVLDGRRTAAPEDFSQDQLALLADAAPSIDHPLIRARVSDLVWLCGRPRRIDVARLAIDTYRGLDLSVKTWARYGRDAWQRAITLCWQLRSGAGSRLAEIESNLLSVVTKADLNEQGFVLAASRLLLENGLAVAQALAIAERFADHGTLLARTDAVATARAYFEAAAAWFQRTGAVDRKADLDAAVAATWMRQAMALLDGPEPIAMQAAYCCEQAIHAYRAVPRGLREDRHIERDLQAAMRLLDRAQRLSVEDMGVVEGTPIDISDDIDAVHALMQGRPRLEALLALVQIHPGAHLAELERDAREILSSTPLMAMMAHQQVAPDGRVIARRPGVEPGDTASPDYQKSLQDAMIGQFLMDVNIAASSRLRPALEGFLLDHRLQEADLCQLTEHAPIVPPEARRLIAKGLLAGFERDIASSIHLLAPQLEAMARWHLKNAAARTHGMSRELNQHENGLSTLITLPEFVPIFGPARAFEIEALFCSQVGPNLRNEVAHGLLTDASSQTPYTFYAWWWMLRLVVTSFVAARRAVAPEE